MNFAADLQSWRGRLSLTRAQAAEHLGVPTTTLLGWLAGRVPTHEETLRRLMAKIEAEREKT